MRILVFCGTRDAIEKFDMLEGWKIHVRQYSPEQWRETLTWFQATSDAKLAVDRSLIHGWRTPAQTIILFDPSWPFAPGATETKQAVGRRGSYVPDLSDALAYMMAGTRTRRQPSPGMQNLWPPRAIGKSPLLAMPYDNRPRRMVAEDIVFPGGPAYDAVLELDRRDIRWRTDIYLEMVRALELGNLQAPTPVILGFDLGKEFPECNCSGEGFGGGRHTKDCPKYVPDPDKPLSSLLEDLSPKKRD